MRPERLELEGFTAFREAAVVDFDGADLFALTGPTGAGKSSLVDAMCFALYGSVPRYDDQRLVAPAITSGAAEARVRLDFSVEGRSHTAVRVVRRTTRGATTKEARLQHGTEVLAGDADGVTAAVHELLGLSFEHFCRCVVLPQGAFARFLHDKPKDRQALLTDLLDLGFYATVGQAAGHRAVSAAQQAVALEERLSGELAGATPDAVREVEVRAGQLRRLRARLDEEEPRLAALVQEARTLAARAEEAGHRRELLALVVRAGRPPAAVDAAAELVAAHTAAGTARAALDKAELGTEAAATARAGLGERRPLEAAASAHGRRAQLHRQAAGAREQAAELTAAVAAAAEAGVHARQALATAEELVQQARHADHAAALVATLERDRPCPVCRQPVTVVPEVPPRHDVEAAVRAWNRARAGTVEADEAHRRSGAAVAAAAARVATLEGQMAALDDELSDHPDAGVVATTLARLDAADAAVEEARSFEGRCRRELATAEGRVRAAEAAEREARRRFDAARDQVAGLGPPMPARADLVSDWDELVAWAGAAQQAAEEEGALAADAAAEAERRRRLVEQELEAAADACGVRSSGRRLGEAVAAAEAETEARSKQLAHAVAAAEQARARLAERRAAEQVARLLALHLRSDHFEKWLLDEALAELTSGANGLLEQLSGDAYSLTLDARTRDFAVVDHRNAGECRPVRTLSGGETFLASLALALALADRVAELAASGAARLEAVFLDEGFGTLDPDTLDTVAAAIENLGATGRMVGIVTHVRELAERVPLRFEVTKGPRSSRVDRVLA